MSQSKNKIRNIKEMKSFRANLRRNMPAPEAVLWQQLRMQKLGIKFRRQFSIENYILDFYAPSLKLAIEIDGDSHYLNERSIARDRLRGGKLARYGIKILRFTNHEIMDNLEGVVDRVISELCSTPS